MSVEAKSFSGVTQEGHPELPFRSTNPVWSDTWGVATVDPDSKQAHWAQVLCNGSTGKTRHLLTEIDTLRMQGRQPRDQFAERRLRFGRRRVHAWGAAGANSAPDAIGAGISACSAGFDAVSTAGDLVSNRQSRASVARISWRCTTMSTMPWSFRYSAR